jgi:hypothetical protein
MTGMRAGANGVVQNNAVFGNLAASVGKRVALHPGEIFVSPDIAETLGGLSAVHPPARSGDEPAMIVIRPFLNRPPRLVCATSIVPRRGNPDGVAPTMLVGVLSVFVTCAIVGTRLDSTSNHFVGVGNVLAARTPLLTWDSSWHSVILSH